MARISHHDCLDDRFDLAVISKTTDAGADAVMDVARIELSGPERAIAWIATGALAMIGNWLAYSNAPLDALPGLAIMLVTVAVGYMLYRSTGSRIPAVCWVSLAGMITTCLLYTSPSPRDCS